MHSPIAPPKWPLRLLRFFLKDHYLEEIEGDLEEEFEEWLSIYSVSRARRKYSWEVIKLLKPNLMKRLSGTYRLNGYGILKNYLKVISRNLIRKKLYTGINVLGMTITIAVSMGILSYVSHELSFDKHHSKSERIARLNYRFRNDKGYDTHWARVDGTWTNSLPDKFPQINQLIRFQSFRPRDVIVGENKYKEEHAFAVDQEIFDVFDFEFISGSADHALKDPFSVVLTRSTAYRYFGKEDPIGKVILINNDEAKKEPYTVTALVESPPPNTHMPITFLSSINRPEDRKGWAYIYMLLNEEVDFTQFEETLNASWQEQYPDGEGQQLSYHLQALEDIHLHSHLSREIAANGRYENVITFLGVAILLLILVAVNFANLNAVQSLDRLKEVGLRKAMGATTHNLGAYFLLEAFVLTLICVFLGLSLFALLLPFLESFIGNSLNFDELLLGQVLTIITMVIVLLSSLYPAQFVARYHPIQALKGGENSKFRGITARNILIGLQFTISIGLISATLIFGRQFRFIQHHNLGYDQDQVMVIAENPFEIIQSYHQLKQELKGIKGVKEVSALMELPTVAIKDMGLLRVQEDPENTVSTDIQTFDANAIDLLGIELIAGQSFDENPLKNLPLVKLNNTNEIRDFLVDRPQTYIINEATMDALGWHNPEEALGRSINWTIGNMVYEYGPIIGVIKNFHQESLKTKIEPLVILNEPHWFRHILIKTSTSNHFDIRQAIESLWEKLFTDIPIEIRYLDQEFEKMYIAENKQLQLMSGFTLIALFIAFLGLFGLIAFSFKTRTKEIAMRKILGASLPRIGLLFGKQYLILTLVSALVAVPVVWKLMSEWLNDYAYRHRYW